MRRWPVFRADAGSLVVMFVFGMASMIDARWNGFTYAGMGGSMIFWGLARSVSLKPRNRIGRAVSIGVGFMAIATLVAARWAAC
jgi:hypothetical protein